MKVSVILPTYNERGNIVQLSRELIEQIAGGAGHEPQIVIVDDNSPDGTAEEARSLSKQDLRVKVIVRQEKGLASAIRRGIEESDGSVLVLMDCDFSHPPQFVPVLLKELEEADAAFASRYVRGGSMVGDKAQHLLSKLFNYVIKMLLGIAVLDSTNGFFAIRREALEGIDKDAVFQGYGDYCFRMLYHLKPKRLRIHEVPFRYMPRRYGKSKTSLLKTGISYWVEALRLRFKK